METMLRGYVYNGFRYQRLKLAPNQSEVVHHEIAANVTALIADRVNRDWNAAVGDSEIDAQVSTLSRG